MGNKNSTNEIKRVKKIFLILTKVLHTNADDDAAVVLDDLAWTEDDNSRDSTLSDVFTPCTPVTMSMTDARAQGMYKRRCTENDSEIVKTVPMNSLFNYYM